MRIIEIAGRSLEILKRRGASKAQVKASETEKHELWVDAGQISLFRTTHNDNLINTAILDERRGSYSSNQLDDTALEEAAETAIVFAKASPPDPAYDIAAKQSPENFVIGRSEPDRELMFERLKAFLDYVAHMHPKVMIRQAALSFDHERTIFLNTNGVNFLATGGNYNFGVVFSSKNNDVITSFNYTGCAMRDLGRELITYGSLADSLARSEAELDSRPLSGKFEGEIVLAPDALVDFIQMFCDKFLTDPSLIAGTSPLKDRLNQTVAAPALTLKSEPLSMDLATNYFFTRDGHKAQNSRIIDHGNLKSFLLSLYGANKTSQPRAVNDGSCYIVEPGTVTREDLIRSVKRGLYVIRTSGGTPNDRGDFSFVAKNSFLIEDGEIRYPVQEVMISGNLLDVYKNIQGISREQINFGFHIFPWLKTVNLTISGK